MSGQSESTPKSEQKWEDKDFELPTEPEFAEQPDDEELDYDELSTESEDIPPGQEVEDEGADASQEGDREVELQELTQPRTGDKHRDSPDVEGEIVTKEEPVKMSESGEGQS